MRTIERFFTHPDVYDKKNAGKYKTNAMGKEKHNKKSIRILIVEDEATVRKTFAVILKDQGYEVETAADGYEAIEKAGKKPFDIAFIDIILNGFNGVEAFEKIKKVNPDIIVIMMTAYSVEDMVRKALKKGAYTCIYKPFDIDKIVNLIKKICNKKLH